MESWKYNTLEKCFSLRLRDSHFRWKSRANLTSKNMYEKVVSSRRTKYFAKMPGQRTFTQSIVLKVTWTDLLGNVSAHRRGT